MKIRTTMITMIAVLGILALAQGAWAELITVNEATASSNFDDIRNVVHLIDGSGLDGDGNHYQYINDGNTPTHWLSTDGDVTGWVMFDLGEVGYTISSFKVWNYNEAAWSVNRGVDGVTIQYGFDGDMTEGTIENALTVTDITSFIEADGTNPYPGVTYTPDSSFDARFVKFDILSSHGATYAGMAEVQFHGTVIPEPGTIALLGLAGLAMLIRRRFVK